MASIASHNCCVGVYKAFTKLNEGFTEASTKLNKGFTEKYNNVVGRLAGRTFESLNGMQLKGTDSTIAKVMKVAIAGFATLTVLPIVALFVAKGAQNLYQCAWGKVTPATPVPTPPPAPAAAPVVAEQAARVPTPPAEAVVIAAAPAVTEQPARVSTPPAEDVVAAVTIAAAPAEEEPRMAQSVDYCDQTPSQTPRLDVAERVETPAGGPIVTAEELDALVASLS